MSKSRTRAVQVPGTDPQPTEDDGAASAAPASDPAAAPPARSGLPLESEIDPYSIDKAVLTQSGWVCPAERRQPRSE